MPPHVDVPGHDVGHRRAEREATPLGGERRRLLHGAARRGDDAPPLPDGGATPQVRVVGPLRPRIRGADGDAAVPADGPGPVRAHVPGHVAGRARGPPEGAARGGGLADGDPDPRRRRDQLQKPKKHGVAGAPASRRDPWHHGGARRRPSLYYKFLRLYIPDSPGPLKRTRRGQTPRSSTDSTTRGSS